MNLSDYMNARRAEEYATRSALLELTGESEMSEEQIAEIKRDIQDGQLVQEAGGIERTTGQSDKLGYDWLTISVNNVVVRKEYVEQENPAGAESNPIRYTDDVPLINNAFYLKDDGKLYVWMDEWIAWEE